MFIMLLFELLVKIKPGNKTNGDFAVRWKLGPGTFCKLADTHTCLCINTCCPACESTSEGASAPQSAVLLRLCAGHSHAFLDNHSHALLEMGTHGGAREEYNPQKCSGFLLALLNRRAGQQR